MAPEMLGRYNGRKKQGISRSMGRRQQEHILDEKDSNKWAKNTIGHLSSEALRCPYDHA